MKGDLTGGVSASLVPFVLTQGNNVGITIALSYGTTPSLQQQSRRLRRLANHHLDVLKCLGWDAVISKKHPLAKESVPWLISRAAAPY